MASATKQTALRSELRDLMVRAWDVGNSIHPGDLTVDKQIAMILQIEPDLADKVWAGILRLLPECARLGMRRCGVRFEHTRLEGPHPDGLFEVRLDPSMREDSTIVVGIGSVVVGGEHVVSVPNGRARQELASWLYEQVSKSASASGLDVNEQYTLMLSWASEEEARDYGKVKELGALNAWHAGVPARDILA